MHLPNCLKSLHGPSLGVGAGELLSRGALEDDPPPPKAGLEVDPPPPYLLGLVNDGAGSFFSSIKG